ncbi:BamA/TamA family outer membrane protein [Pigmentiphaga soli]|uniref:BamA/TamA family outer membrane protein n=1 Tax=Pigmentiphaga soli TaxID=1007095 RepID=A0ABP8H4K1_9BURK
MSRFRRIASARAARLAGLRAARWLALALGVGWAAAGWAARPSVQIAAQGLPSGVLDAVSKAVQSVAALAEDEDGGEATRLRRRARTAAVDALATEGYFSPQVEFGEGGDPATAWDIRIDPGPRTVIEAVDLQFTGTLAGPDFAARADELRRGWGLAEGAPFRNEAWENAKRTLLDAAGAVDFPLARLVETSADVDPQRASARLHVKLDSGPAVRFGQVEVRGLKRVPEGVVERYVRVQPGQRYDRDRMVEWQQELTATPFFSGARLQLDQRGLAPAPAEEVPGLMPESMEKARETGTAPPYQGPPEVTLPILASVTESRPRRMSVSLGVDSEAGPRVESVYRQNVVAGYPVELETGGRLDRLRQLGYADIHLAPDPAGHQDSFGVLAQHSDIEGLDVHRLAVGAIRVYTRKPTDPGKRVEYETRLGSRLAREHVKIDGVESYDSTTATGTIEWLRRDVNDKYDPREGNLIALGAGLGTELDGSNRFGRLTARGQYWWSLSPRDVLTVRAEIGKLWAVDVLRVPDDFAFRTGGARSVRGYRYLGLGRHVGDAILGDATLAVASIEGTHYFNERFGGALFVDTGNVAPSFGQMKLATGVGAGLRVRTPAGPLNLDVAYAVRDKGVRLNFSLGIAF